MSANFLPSVFSAGVVQAITLLSRSFTLPAEKESNGPPHLEAGFVFRRDYRCSIPGFFSRRIRRILLRDMLPRDILPRDSLPLIRNASHISSLDQPRRE